MKYHYTDGSTNYGELSQDEIRARMGASPAAKHLVWREGWTDWRNAREIISLPPVGDLAAIYHYSDGTEKFGAMGTDEILARIAMDPGGKHLVWKEGWPSWRSAAEVFPSTPGTVPEAPPPSGPVRSRTVEAAHKPGGAKESSAPDVSKPSETGKTSGNGSAGVNAKKTRTGMWIGIGAGVILLIVIAVAFLGGSDDASIKSETRPENKPGMYESAAEESSGASNQDEAEVSSPGVDVTMYFNGEAVELAGDWEASSTLEDDTQKYGVQNVADDNAKTVWAEGEMGSGQGARLEFTPFESEVGEIHGFRMLNGHCRTKKLWDANARVRRMLVRSGGDERTVELIDTPDWQYVSLQGFSVQGSIEFEILDVYPGSKYEDLTVSELNIIWEKQEPS